MNVELIKKWVSALRSGEYKQGKKSLRPTEDTYCCLGVICDIYDKSGWSDEERFSYRGDNYILSSETRNKINLLYKDMMELMRMNESGKTFSEIADFIEEIYKDELQ